MENMAEAMMRLRNAKHMDPRHCALVDAAYFAARPQADGAARRKKARGAACAPLPPPPPLPRAPFTHASSAPSTGF
jgi:hypothetical protein